MVRAARTLLCPPFPVPVLPPVPPPRSADDVHREERQIVEQTLSAMRQAIEQLATRQEANLAEMRQATVELALAVAGRVVFDKLQAGDFPIEEMVRQAIAQLPTAPEIVTDLASDRLGAAATATRRSSLIPASGGGPDAAAWRLSCGSRRDSRSRRLGRPAGGVAESIAVEREPCSIWI